MSQFDVLTVGNAIVDIISRCDDQFLIDNGITKSAMNLIDAERAERLYGMMGPAVEASGGSAGNTAAGIANFGGKAAYFGKVSEDQLGEIFTHDIRAQGVHFETRPLGSQPPTARSMIFVTEDGERSMNTYLGACVEFGPEDVEPEVVAKSKVTYFEGYLWDPPRAKQAILDCARISHEAGQEMSMTLSDSFCVDRYRDEFLDLMRSGTVDIVFANAGTGGPLPLGKLTAEHIDETFDTNVKGAFFVAQEVGKRMLARSRGAAPGSFTGGRIINIASMAGLKVLPQIGAYCMSKAAVVQMTKAMAIEWGRFGINVNAICPGYIDTEINHHHWQTEQGKKLIDMLPRKRVGNAQDLDALLVMLASDQSHFINGAVIAADDGFGV